MADNEYDCLEKIGHGSFGIIRKVKRKSDGHVLCRKEINYIKMSYKEREQLYAEFQILSSLRHPNIVAYYHREHLKDTQDLHIYMEYCGGGDLGQVIKNLKDTNKLAEEEFVWSMFSQILTALYRCHYGVNPPDAGSNVFGPVPSEKPMALKGKQGQVMILHRDLKPENIFLGEDQSVKLGDFGLSKLLQSHDFASTYVGTPYYMSPEICAAERYTLYSDIWSLGCIMYELCAKKPPFNSRSHIGLVQKIRQGKFDPLPSMYSTELRNAITMCLKVNPTARPDTATLLRLPAVRLMRKQQEVVDLGRILKKREEVVTKKMQELKVRETNLELEKEQIPREIEDRLHEEIEAQVRREWELKARLEIDRQVNNELERLRKKFDREVQEKLEVELEKASRKTTDVDEPLTTPVSPPGFPTSSLNEDSEFPLSTDDSDLSVEPPSPQKTEAVKKSKRTPFGRSKTTSDSPTDVQMSEPSPMSIASLSLSPRRNAVPMRPGVHLFTRAQPPARLESQTILYSDDEEEDFPDLESPTLPKKMEDPFKVPARPGLLRHNTTATMPKLNSQQILFPPPKNKAQTPASVPAIVPQSDLRPSGLEGKQKSPNRRLSKIPSTTTLSTDAISPTRRPSTKSNAAKAKDGGEEMVKAVLQRNMNMGGRTLVELAQAKAGSKPMDEMDKRKRLTPIESKMGPKSLDEEKVWDPEKDEMPSPFLVRGSRAVKLIR